MSEWVVGVFAVLVASVLYIVAVVMLDVLSMCKQLNTKVDNLLKMSMSNGLDRPEAKRRSDRTMLDPPLDGGI
jgi:hypothetical protein